MQRRLLTIIASAALALALLPATGYAASGDDQADAVWGQTDFTSNVNQGCSPFDTPSNTMMCEPHAAVTDGHGNLWVADYNYSRVLMFPYNSTTGRPNTTPTIIFGHYGSSTDAECNESPPGGSSYPNAPSAYTLCSPYGLAIDHNGTLYVSDSGNNRVLAFLNAAHKTSGDPADLVLGQSDFSTTGPNDTPGGTSTPSGGGSFTCPSIDTSVGPATQCTLDNPAGLAVDPRGGLLVADNVNDRVLYWPVSTLSAFHAGDCNTSCFIPADVSWGQYYSFQTTGEDQPLPSGGFSGCSAPSPASACVLAGPWGVAVDDHNDLFVADHWDSRVVEYDGALTTGTQIATLVYGQHGSFRTVDTDQGGSISASTLSDPDDVAIDPDGGVWIADSDNNRVLKFPPASSASPTTSSTAIAVLGQGGSFTTGTFNNGGSGGSPAAGSLAQPYSIRFDGAGNAYVADQSNNRVLQFVEPYPVPIRAGWNLVDLPVNISGVHSLGTLLSAMNSQGIGGAASVAATYASGRFTLYVKGYSADQTVTPSQGVFVLSSTSGTWKPTAAAFVSAQTVHLTRGWNLAAVPYPYPGLYTDTISAEIGTASVTQIALYQGGTYHVWHTGDAPIVVPAGVGVWILTNTAKNWTPV